MTSLHEAAPALDPSDVQQDDVDRARQAALRVRRRRRAAAFVAGIAFAALVAVAAAEVISYLAGSPLRILAPGTVPQGGDTPWDDPVMLVSSALVALVGAGLLVYAALAGGGEGSQPRSGPLTWVADCALRSLLADAACSVDGVRTAYVVVHGPWIRVRVTTDPDAEVRPADVEAAVAACLRERLHTGGFRVSAAVGPHDRV
ncbi:DUF6286 domain-containing protein [Nocardiopsis composta]|uniref:DUF6286 domain-containing protein n=1 Tax=Nocardiopsis composta TaxID=157465 RepID=A0A7W8QSF0_9ACTN|nr:DUF6286 domain-containing protein [Nocardiopsis composta]MBB5434721.1 hypothetical protein [Nocardiopsis composta]